MFLIAWCQNELRSCQIIPVPVYSLFTYLISLNRSVWSIVVNNANIRRQERLESQLEDSHRQRFPIRICSCLLSIQGCMYA